MGKSGRTKMQTTLDLEKVVETTLGNADYKLFINGNWRPADNGGTFPLTNPATGENLTTVPQAGASETPAAIDAAAAALPRGAATPPPTRAAMMRRGAALMLERREPLATI